MPNILLVYGTSEGQTGKIARHIETTLEAGGAVVRTIEGHDLEDDLAVGEYDGVIVGASVHAGKHDKRIAHFVKDHLASLERLPSAFFSVSLSAAEDDDQAKADVERMLNEFTEETGWHPDSMDAFAGAIVYTMYNPIIRFIMKRKVARHRDDTDTSRDYEYTDWDGVTAFGIAFLEQLKH